MAHSKQAKKRIRTNDKARLRNKAVSSKMRTLVKRVMTAAESGDKATAEGTLALAIQAVDKAAKTNVIHKNAAARKVSQLTRAVQKAGA
ncbi:MAG: 30S ribosomal protein S20 [Planctomycetota bacterium]|nr:30S ribosomal protein S20 [Planctomycetota bacterium]MDA0933684.1 30S ribosomal protein S20 [Planctomycetota bacterium]MDA1221743.1 30S ribosomal protein S20 [Planctomycetota bacterium]